MIRTTPAHERDHEPVPDPSTLMGLLHVLLKAHMEVVGKDAAHQRFSQVATRGDARQYIEELMPHLVKEREKRRLHRHSGGK
jgi:DNA-binding winged helix-turn-helix (wHTH) protein